MKNALYTLLFIFISISIFAADQVVTNNLDDGSGGTLREAIAAVGTGETITFNLNAGYETIIISSELSITKSMTIDGSNTVGSGVEITVQVPTPEISSWRVFNINASNKTININNITIKGGDISGNGADLSGYGGGILLDDGTLNLNYVTVSDSKAYNAGGIDMYNITCNLTLDGCTVTRNTATNIGGGIFNNFGTATILNSTICNNTGELYSGGIGTGTSILYLINTTISGNDGGTNGPGGFYTSDKTYMLNTIVINNTKDAGEANDIWNGGTTYAYYSWYNAVTGSITSQISAPNITTAYSAGDLGALQDNGGSTQTMALSLTAPAFESGALAFYNTTDGYYFYDNQTTPVDHKLSDWGTNPGSPQESDKITIDQRGISRHNPPAVGAYQNLVPTIVTINLDDGGVGTLRYIVANCDEGAEITFDLESDNEVISISSELTINRNLTINGANLEGSGVEVTVQVTDPGTSIWRVFNINASEKTVAISNMIIKGGDVTENSDPSYYYGGSILLFEGTLNLDNVIITGSKAYGGGGIFINENTICSIEGCTISHCTATNAFDSGGGGIICAGTISSINNTTINFNSTDGWGGGIYKDGGTLTSLTNSCIDNNTGHMGGGVVFEAATIGSIINCTVSNNIASSSIGGIHINGSSINNMNFCTISNNSSAEGTDPEHDIGMVVFNSTVTIQNSILANNNNFDYYFIIAESTGSLTDNGNNIVGKSNVATNATGGFNNATSILYNTKHGDPSTTETSWSQGGVALTNQNLNLSSTLADNGGPTQTHAIESGSFAIVAGSWDASVSADQRGFTRSNPPTIGAYEYLTNTWTGAVSSTWGDNANWSRNTVPVVGINVEIPDVSKGFAPVIGSTESAVCLDLNIESEASLTIESNESGIGSLITNGTITNKGTVNIQSYVSDETWHLVAVPSTGITANNFLGDYLQNWDETNHAWTDIAEPETELYPKQGYGLWATAGKSTTYTFTGTPLTGNQTQGITFTEYSAEPGAFEGANLLGNPYPSYIDWDEVSGYGAKYTWNSANGSYDAYTAVGGYGTGSQYLKPMEGFFIVTESTGNFELNNSQRTNDNSKKSAKGFEKGLVLAANSGEYENTLYLVFDETASENFELAKDAWKFMSGTHGLAEIYSINDDQNFAVDVCPETKTIQLGFSNDLAGVYSIAIKEIADIPEAFLEDTKTNTFFDLTKGAYEFAWDSETDLESRFKLHLNAVGIEESAISESNILIYAADGQIFIKNVNGVQTHGRASVTVTDMMGRTVLQQTISASELTAIPVNLKTGVYIVSVKSGNEIKTEKIFIK